MTENSVIQFPSQALLQSALTPSEAVLLNGEQFAPQGGIFDSYRLPSTAILVSRKQLAITMFKAAFLAAESSGAVSFSVRSKEALLGPSGYQALYIEPGSAGSWPECSLEGRIHAVTQNDVTGKGKFKSDLTLPRSTLSVKYAYSDNEVRKVIHALLEHPSCDPYESALSDAMTMISKRGLATRVAGTTFGVWVWERYELREGTMIVAKSHVGSTHRLLEACRNDRPHLWELLTRQVKLGIRSRTDWVGTGDW